RSHVPSLPTRRSSDLRTSFSDRLVGRFVGALAAQESKPSLCPEAQVISLEQDKKSSYQSVGIGISKYSIESPKCARILTIVRAPDRKSTRLNSSHVKI